MNQNAQWNSEIYRLPTLRGTTEPLYVISIKYRLSLPDDGSYVSRNMLEYILVRVFYTYI
jgi:hypothetical protein